MSYIFSICLLTSHISISLYTDRSETGSPCLPAHLPSTCLKYELKTTRLLIPALIIIFYQNCWELLRCLFVLITWKGWVRKLKKEYVPDDFLGKNHEGIEILAQRPRCITILDKVGIEFKAPCCICGCAGCMSICVCVCMCVCVCHWLVWFSSNVVTRAGHLVGVKSKCHRDQCRAVGVAFHICLWRFIDVGCLKWILTAMTPTTENRIH